MDELCLSPDLASLPTLFRIESLIRHPLPDGTLSQRAVLFHDQASLSVTWTSRQADPRLFEGGLASPRYCRSGTCSDGAIGISRLVAIEKAIQSQNLFQTVPMAWVPNRDLLRRASCLFNLLSPPYQELLNGVLWDAGIFQGFCTGPSSLKGHHAEWNGNLRHTIEVTEAVLGLLPQHTAADPQISLAAALLHDVGKALEYEPAGKFWKLSRIGRINGHKQIVGDLIAVAVSRMTLPLPQDHYASLRHAIGAARDVPFESGYRCPVKPEALLLSVADRSSGGGDLFAQRVPKEGNWAPPHPHLGKEPLFIVNKANPPHNTSP
jgi:3'-5' exoribonuclease